MGAASLRAVGTRLYDSGELKHGSGDGWWAGRGCWSIGGSRPDLLQGCDNEGGFGKLGLSFAREFGMEHGAQLQETRVECEGMRECGVSDSWLSVTDT